METVCGYVDHIIFRNRENGYTVLNLISEGEEITCVGLFSTVEEGESLEAKGDYTTHPSYGKQFQVKAYETAILTDAVSTERYLASGAVKGIGAALAARIVREFGEDTFRIMEEEPERLASIKGISMRMAGEIAGQMAEKKELRAAMIFLQKYGVPMSMALRIQDQYGPDLYEVIQTNPYRLADEVQGVGFKTADEIAKRVGIRTDSEFRIRSGILYVLQQAALNGHTCLPKKKLIQNTVQLLGTDPEEISRMLMDLMIERKTVAMERGEDELVFPASYYNMEGNIAWYLTQMNASFPVKQDVLDAQIKKMEKESGISLDPMQAEAVRAAAGNGLLVITGGPGTGKTTIINMIIRYFLQEGLEFLLAAPTGRAAKRMSETTGYEASTIHRMLELSGDPEGVMKFERNEKKPLECDAVIIDEMSMVDVSLMLSLLRALIPGTRLILVGDVSQLPSVGPGSVLSDIIASKVCPTVALNRIFRQAAKSDIILNAHRINAGRQVVLDNQSRDFFFLKRSDADQILRVSLSLVKDKLPAYVGAPSEDIQILSPMRKGLLGVERINEILQRYLNPPAPAKKEKKLEQRLFREGDKVMQIRNNYRMEWKILSRYGIPSELGLGVFNGDTGVIRRIDHFSKTVTVEFEDRRMAEYAFSQLDEIELAYAVTIHKSQGSEYPAVVIPLLKGPEMLYNRNLLYTAVTRARKCVVIVGDEDVFRHMIDNGKAQARYGALRERIREAMQQDSSRNSYGI